MNPQCPPPRLPRLACPGLFLPISNRLNSSCGAIKGGQQNPGFLIHPLGFMILGLPGRQDAAKTHPKRPKPAPRRAQDTPMTLQQVLRLAQEAPRGPQEAPKTAPRRPQDDPRGSQDAPKTAQDDPSRFQDAPKTRQDAFLKQKSCQTLIFSFRK